MKLLYRLSAVLYGWYGISVVVFVTYWNHTIRQFAISDPMDQLFLFQSGGTTVMTIMFALAWMNMKRRNA